MNNYKKVTKVLWIILIANVLVAAIKIILGFKLKINSLSADGFHSITDSTSNIVGLIGIKLASKPADKKHQYGHQKIETIAGLFIGFMLLLITFNIFYQAVMWFINPVKLEIPLYGIISIIVTLIINLGISYIEEKKGKELNSEVLVLDALHTRSDCFISTGVILTLVLIRLGMPMYIDPIFSFIIGIFIAKACYDIFKRTIEILIDSSIVDDNEVKDYILTVDENILDIHKLRSRGKESCIYIDFHLVLPEDKTVDYIHILNHKIEDSLRKFLSSNVEIMVHVEPPII